jgi:hypothetical protein
MPELKPTQIVARPSSSPVQQSVVEKQTLASNWVKLKEIKVTYPGVYRIKFALRKGGTGDAYAQVYRNGAGVGTIQQSTTTNYATFSEDIGGWKAGDTLELWGYATAGGAGGACAVMAFSQWGEYSQRPPDIPPGEVTLA